MATRSHDEHTTPKKQGHLTELEIKLSKSSETFHLGDHVKYSPSGLDRLSSGTIEDIVSVPGKVGNRKYKASSDEPKLVIKNDNSGKRSALKTNKIVGYVDTVPSVKGH